MRPMIRLGNLNARPSCPAAAPGSTVWVYLYAAGHWDMPGDSPAGNKRLSGTRAQDGKFADTCAKEKPPPCGAGRQHGVGLKNLPAGTGAACRFTGHTPVPSQTAASGERTAGRQHGVGQKISRHEPERHTDSQGAHRCHRKPPQETDSGQTAWRGAGIHTGMNRTLRSSTYLQGTHQRHSKTAARKTGGGWICGWIRR